MSIPGVDFKQDGSNDVEKDPKQSILYALLTESTRDPKFKSQLGKQSGKSATKFSTKNSEPPKKENKPNILIQVPQPSSGDRPIEVKKEFEAYTVFNCSLCSGSFREEAELKNHIVFSHSKPIFPQPPVYIHIPSSYCSPSIPVDQSNNNNCLIEPESLVMILQDESIDWTKELSAQYSPSQYANSASERREIYPHGNSNKNDNHSNISSGHVEKCLNPRNGTHLFSDVLSPCGTSFRESDMVEIKDEFIPSFVTASSFSYRSTEGKSSDRGVISCTGLPAVVEGDEQSDNEPLITNGVKTTAGKTLTSKRMKVQYSSDKETVRGNVKPTKRKTSPVSNGDGVSVEVRFVCGNDGCVASFKHRMSRYRHMKKCPINCNNDSNGNDDNNSNNGNDNNNLKNGFEEETTKKNGNNNNNRCNACGMSFNNPSNLMRHMNDEHKGPLKTSNCPHCGKYYKRMDLYNRHLKKCQPLSPSSLSPSMSPSLSSSSSGCSE